MKKLLAIGLACCILTAAGPALASVTISVPAESCIYFAGQTQPGLESSYPPSLGWELVPWNEGGVNGATFYNDTAKWKGVVRAYSGGYERTEAERTASSIIAPYVDVTGWEGIASITAAGLWAHGPHCAYSDADGYGANDTTQNQYGVFGISLVTAPWNTLVGVFLANDAPDPAATPISLTLGVDDMDHPRPSAGVRHRVQVREHHHSGRCYPPVLGLGEWVRMVEQRRGHERYCYPDSSSRCYFARQYWCRPCWLAEKTKNVVRS